MQSRAFLEKSAERHKLLLKKEMSSVSKKAINNTLRFIILGGVAGISYLILRNSDTSKKSKSKTPWQRISSVLIKKVMLVVLEEGRNKIEAYLDELKGNDS